MCKEITIKEAVAHVKDGDTIMVGGFMTNGTPEKLIDALVEKGVKDLTLICNDAGFPDKGVGKMVANKQFSTIIASHIGLNREAGRQMTEGETVIDLVPQGTLAERMQWRFWARRFLNTYWNRNRSCQRKRSHYY